MSVSEELIKLTKIEMGYHKTLRSCRTCPAIPAWCSRNSFEIPVVPCGVCRCFLAEEEDE